MSFLRRLVSVGRVIMRFLRVFVACLMITFIVMFSSGSM